MGPVGRFLRTKDDDISTHVGSTKLQDGEMDGNGGSIFLRSHQVHYEPTDNRFPSHPHFVNGQHPYIWWLCFPVFTATRHQLQGEGLRHKLIYKPLFPINSSESSPK